MKVTNWRKKLAAAIIASGIWSPSIAHAVNITLGDPNFDTYPVSPYSPGAPPDGFAYANAYRVGANASAWVDDLGPPAGYAQDNVESNWLYRTAYGEDGPPFRGAPRSGDQAMHGRFNYNAQVTGATFQAGQTYTFSLWAQGDHDASATSSGVFMYILRGDLASPFSSPLQQALFTQGAGHFNNRTNGMLQGDSQNFWRQISISHTVGIGAPEIGMPVAVGFFLRPDAAVEDATLTAVPEPATAMLVGMGGLSLVALRRRR